MEEPSFDMFDDTSDEDLSGDEQGHNLLDESRARGDEAAARPPAADEADIDLAHVVAFQARALSSDLEEARDMEVSFVREKFLPLDVMQDCLGMLCVFFSTVVSECSDRTAEFVSNGLPRNIVSAYYTNLSTGSPVVSLSPLGCHRLAGEKGYWWDYSESAPKVLPSKGTVGADQIGVDRVAVRMMESMARAVQTTEANVRQLNCQRRSFGGAYGCSIVLFGPCADGGLRLSAANMGSLRLAMFDTQGECVHTLPARNFENDYQPVNTKWTPRDGLKVKEGVLRASWHKDQQASGCHCSVSRGYGYVELLTHTPGPGGQAAVRKLQIDQKHPVLKRQPDVCLVNINLDQDRLIIVASANLVAQVGWKRIHHDISVKLHPYCFDEVKSDHSFDSVILELLESYISESLSTEFILQVILLGWNL